MKRKDSDDFDDYFYDDNNVSPAQRAKIEFEVELIGKLIEAREAKGLTQEQLAKAAGVTQSAIARLERMKATPQIDTLFKGVSRGYLLRCACIFCPQRPSGALQRAKNTALRSRDTPYSRTPPPASGLSSQLRQTYNTALNTAFSVAPVERRSVSGQAH